MEYQFGIFEKSLLSDKIKESESKFPKIKTTDILSSVTMKFCLNFSKEKGESNIKDIFTSVISVYLNKELLTL